MLSCTLPAFAEKVSGAKTDRAEMAKVLKRLSFRHSRRRQLRQRLRRASSSRLTFVGSHD